MSDPTQVARQYDTASLIERIDAALAHVGLTGAGLGWRDLAPLDQFHSRGLAATEEAAAALAPEAESHVLDIGCGVGGPARLLAATYGCQVTGTRPHGFVVEFFEIDITLPPGASATMTVRPGDRGDAVTYPILSGAPGDECLRGKLIFYV